MENCPDLLQEVEVTNVDVDLTTDSSQINEGNDNMNITMEEDQDTVEYKNNLKFDVKNISKIKNNNMETNV